MLSKTLACFSCGFKVLCILLEDFFWNYITIDHEMLSFASVDADQQTLFISLRIGLFSETYNDDLQKINFLNTSLFLNGVRQLQVLVHCTAYLSWVAVSTLRFSPPHPL